MQKKRKKGEEEMGALAICTLRSFFAGIIRREKGGKESQGERGGGEEPKTTPLS